MPLQMTETEAAAFFARINRPCPSLPNYVHEKGVAAVREALAGYKAKRKKGC